LLGRFAPSVNMLNRLARSAKQESPDGNAIAPSQIRSSGWPYHRVGGVISNVINDTGGPTAPNTRVMPKVVSYP
jgi:hypothetical protein